MCTLSTPAPAGSCSWSGGVWSGRGECMGKPRCGWQMPSPQPLRVAGFPSRRALPSEIVSLFGRRFHPNPLPTARPSRAMPPNARSLGACLFVLATTSPLQPVPGAASCPLSFPYLPTCGDSRIFVTSRVRASLFHAVTCPLPGTIGSPRVFTGAPARLPT